MQHQNQRPINKHLPQGLGVKNYVPYQQQSYSQGTAQSQTGSNASTAQNTYTPGQTDLQGNLGQLYQQLLGGNIPSSFTNPAAATNAYNSNFNTQVAPGLAAQYGAGSPVIGSQNALGLAQLQGNLYNSGVQNYTNALGQGTQYALSPTGTSGTGVNNQSSTAQSAGQQNTNINPLAYLAQLLGY